MQIKKHIPNFITCCNLFLGTMAVSYAGNYNFKEAVYCIVLGAICDFFDGQSARWLNVKSAIGKELDSLADIITFGMAPGMIMFNLTSKNAYAFYEFNSALYFVFFTCLLIPVFSGLRLAKFNVDTRQNNNFIGLPTPAMALYYISFPMILENRDFTHQFHDHIINTFTFSITNIVMCFLMVSPLPFMSIKGRRPGIKDFKYHIGVILVSVPVIIMLGWAAAPFILLAYAGFSFFEERERNKTYYLRRRQVSQLAKKKGKEKPST